MCQTTYNGKRMQQGTNKVKKKKKGQNTVKKKKKPHNAYILMAMVNSHQQINCTF